MARRSSESSPRTMRPAPDSTSSPVFSSPVPRATRRTTSRTPMRRQRPISSSPQLARPTTSRPELRRPPRPVRRRSTPPRRRSTHPPRLPTRAGRLDPRRSPTSRPQSRPSKLATGAPLMVGVVPRLPPRDLRMATSGLARRSAARLRPSDPEPEFEVDAFGTRKSSHFVYLFYYFMKSDS